LSLDHFNTALNVVDVILLFAGIKLILTMMHRQHRDISDGRRLTKMIAQLAVLTEEDSRKNRHAIKNIASTLKLQQIADDLQRSIEEDEIVKEQPGTLVAKLVDLASDSGEEARETNKAAAS
jgi:hypothetical protein